MNPQQDYKGIIKEIKNDKVMIWPLRVIVIVLSIALVIDTINYNIDRMKGKPTKMIYGLFEANYAPIKIIVHDTIKVIVRDTIIIRDKGKINNIKELGVMNQY